MKGTKSMPPKYEHMIDWDQLVLDYNQMKKANHTSVEGLLKHLYKENHNLKKMDAILGVSWPMISDKMDELKISRRRNPNRFSQPISIIKNLPESVRKKMTSKQIAEKAGCTRMWARCLMRRNGMDFKRCSPGPLKGELNV